MLERVSDLGFAVQHLYLQLLCHLICRVHSPVSGEWRTENLRHLQMRMVGGWKEYLQDFDCKWNEPVVGGEGEEPVGQNPVVSKTDPRYLRNVIVKALLTMVVLVILSVTGFL